MAAILGATDSDGKRELLECLSLVETHFIETHESRLKASSIKTHLFALKRFADLKGATDSDGTPAVDVCFKLFFVFNIEFPVEEMPGRSSRKVCTESLLSMTL